jgi:hypothetical protein
MFWKKIVVGLDIILRLRERREMKRRRMQRRKRR